MSSASEEIKNHEEKMDLTPMIDVTFLLLIFFMLASKFKTEEGQILAYLPKNRGQSSGSYKEVTEVRIYFQWCTPSGYGISNDKKVGRPVMYLVNPGVSQKLLENGGLPDYDQLASYIRQEKQAYSGSNEKGLPVIIDGHPYVPWKWLVKALDVAVEEQIQDITFAAKEKPR